jgi:hypothetical protein
MMTKIGKLLVFVNIFFSVGLLTWAVSMYTNRIDWLDSTNADGKVEGQISTLKKEIDRLSRAITDANAGFIGKKYLMASAEERSDTRSRVFADRLNQARNGKFKLQLTSDKGAFGEGVMYDIEREGTDILGPDNKPLRGVKTLQDEFAAEVGAIKLLQAGNAVMTEQQWMEILSGQTTVAQVQEMLPKLGINDLRRLHATTSDLIARDEAVIVRQRVAETNLKDESVYLSEKRINWVAELQTLKRREEQLLKAIEKLGGK